MTERLVTKGVGGSLTRTPYQIPAALPTAGRSPILSSESTGVTRWAQSPQFAAGFENRTGSVLSMIGNMLTITRTGVDYTVFVDGLEFVKTAVQDIAITTDLAQTYVWFDAASALQASTAGWTFLPTQAPVCTVYKDGANYAVCDERHGYKRNLVWHEWAHDNIGAMYDIAGGGLTGTFTNTTLSITQGVIADEDLILDTLATKTSCRLWYRHVGAASMDFESAILTPYKAILSVLQYDNAGTLTPLSAGEHVNSWVYATNDIAYPIYVVVGQAKFNTQNLANADTAPLLPMMTSLEWKLIYRVTYRQVGVGTPTFSAAFDMRRTTTGPAAGVVSGAHSALTGRDVANSHPSTAIFVDTASFGTLFAATDDTVQLCLDKVEDVLGTSGTPQWLRIGVGTVAHANIIINAVLATASTAVPVMQLENTNTGDTYSRYITGGTDSYALGIDKTDTTFQVAYGNAANAEPGTSTLLKLTAGGNMTVTGTAQALRVGIGVAPDAIIPLYVNAGIVGVGTNVNTKMTENGVTIYGTTTQNDAYFALMRFGVNQGYTNRADVTCFLDIRNSNVSAGGTNICGMSSNSATTVPMGIVGTTANIFTAKDSTALAPVTLYGCRSNSGSANTPTADGNVLSVRAGYSTPTTLLVLDAEGQLHINETSTDTWPTIDMKQSSSGDVGIRVGCAANRSYMLGIDNDASLYNFQISTAASATAVLGTTPLLTLTSGGMCVITDPTAAVTTNTFMTSGLTLSQGAADNEIFAGKSSDVAHGMTSNTDTDTFFTIAKSGATVGGALLTAYTESSYSLRLQGAVTSASTDKTTAAYAPIELRSFIKSGTTLANMGADANLFLIRNGSSGAAALWVFDAEGQLHINETSTDTFPTIDCKQSSSGDVGIRVGCAANRSYMLGIDNDASLYNFQISTAASATAVLGTTPLLTLTSGGMCVITDPTAAVTTNTFMTSGLTLSQGAADDEIFCCKSSDMNGGYTSHADTDVWFSIKKASAGAGGAYALCLTEVTLALDLECWGTTDNVVKTVAGGCYSIVTLGKKAGTTITSPGADANLWGISKAGVGRLLIVDSEGQLHINETSTDTWPTIDCKQSSSGDVGIRVGCAANRSYMLGIDNDASTYPFKISTAASATAVLGTGDLLTLTSGANLGIGGAPDVAGVGSTYDYWTLRSATAENYGMLQIVGAKTAAASAYTSFIEFDNNSGLGGTIHRMGRIGVKYGGSTASAVLVLDASSNTATQNYGAGYIALTGSSGYCAHYHADGAFYPHFLTQQGSTGDAGYDIAIGTTRAYGLAIDNSEAGDPLVICTAAAGYTIPGTNNLLVLTSAGVMTVTSTIQGTRFGAGVTPDAVIPIYASSASAGKACLRLTDTEVDVTNKNGLVVGRHYTNTEEDVLTIGSYSATGLNDIYIGGGYGSYNAATNIYFYAAANSTTLAGSQVASITGAGLLTAASMSVTASLTAGYMVGATPIGGYVSRGSDVAAADYSIAGGTLTADTTVRDLDMSAIIPAGAKGAILKLNINDAAATGLRFIVTPQTYTNLFNSTVVRTQAAGVSNDGIAIVALDSGRTIHYLIDAAMDVASIVVLGWFL